MLPFGRCSANVTVPSLNSHVQSKFSISTFYISHCRSQEKGYINRPKNCHRGRAGFCIAISTITNALPLRETSSSAILVTYLV